jgi:mRNA-degrading endonuclease RelE of RelBE toxin-antitoxin system
MKTIALIGEQIESLKQNPRPPDAKTLKGNSGDSLRVGVYRVLCNIDDASSGS